MVNQNDSVMKFQLPTDRQILEELSKGRNVGANIATDIDKHRKTVNPRLRQLDDYGLVNNIGNGVYELTEKGEIVLEHFEKYHDSEVDFEKFLNEKLKDE